SRLGRVQHALDAPTKAARRFGLGFPDRRKTGQDANRVDAVNWLIPYWLAMRRERLAPLPAIFQVLEAALDAVDKLDCELTEGLGAGLPNFGFPPCSQRGTACL